MHPHLVGRPPLGLGRPRGQHPRARAPVHGRAVQDRGPRRRGPLPRVQQERRRAQQRDGRVRLAQEGAAVQNVSESKGLLMRKTVDLVFGVNCHYNYRT